MAPCVFFTTKFTEVCINRSNLVLWTWSRNLFGGNFRHLGPEQTTRFQSGDSPRAVWWSTYVYGSAHTSAARHGAEKSPLWKPLPSPNRARFGNTLFSIRERTQRGFSPLWFIRYWNIIVKVGTNRPNTYNSKINQSINVYWMHPTCTLSFFLNFTCSQCNN